MNQTIQPYLSTIQRLETLIQKLEVNVGVEHKPSPFDAYVQVEKQPVQLPKEEPKQEHQQPKEEQKQQEKKPQEKKQQEKKQQPEKKQEKTESSAPEQQQQQQQKKKPEKKPAQPKEEPVDLGDLKDFVNVDIRVGELKECWKHPESDNLYCEKIDIGNGEIREIASGLQKFVPLEEMKGLVIVLVNLKARKLAGFQSNGMILCASNADHTEVELLRPKEGSKVGERVKVAGKLELFNDAREPELNPKKKFWENSQPLLKTNDNLEAGFNNQLLVTSAGTILSKTLKGGSIS